ncbi:hypothetical protein RQP46_000732 [Phenoliferia psychrophenolica]
MGLSIQLIVFTCSLTNPLLGPLLNGVVGTLVTDPVFALLSPITAPALRTANSVAGPINKVLTGPFTAPIIAFAAQTTGDFEAPFDCLSRPLTGTGVYGCDGGGVLSSAQGPVGGEPYTGQLDPFGNDYYAPDKPKVATVASVAVDGGNPTSATPAVAESPAPPVILPSTASLPSTKMGSSSEKKHKSSHREKDRDGDGKDSSSKRHKSSHSHRSSSKKHDRAGGDDDGDEWVEKEAYVPAIAPPTRAPVDTFGTFNPGQRTMAGDGVGLSAVEGLTDGFGEGEDGSSAAGNFGGGISGGDDLFSSMGVERKRREIKEKPDPTQTMGQSSRELNKAHWQGIPNDPTTTPAAPSGSPAPGSSGSAWRMKKVQRTFETAEEENRPVEEVALERYGSDEAWREALDERRILDEREDRRRGRAPGSTGGYGSGSRPGGGGGGGGGGGSSSNSGPGGAAPGTPTDSRRPGEALERTNSSSSAGPNPSSRPGTPVPTVFTPPVSRTPRVTSTLSQSVVVIPDPTTTATKPVLTQSELNKLQAKVLKARLMGNDNAAELEKEYEVERQRTLEGGPTVAIPGGAGESVKVLPTLDGRGRLYDIGTGGEEEEVIPGKRVKKDKAFESHDVKTGERIRHNPDDDSQTLDELVRQERFSAGAQDQKDMDYEMASRIAGDTRFQNNLDYVDENAEKLARKKMKSDVLKKAFAVQDYARTKKALDNCSTCFGDEGEAPKAAVVALGTRAYLGLLENEELVKGHCRIVPIQHHFSSLDADDETWDEIKNFMKTLMQLFAEEDKGVVFFESCISLKHQKHTCIEAIPVPFDLFDEIPAYFSEAIDNSEQEWSQHKKRIIFTSARPFRRSLVPNLPYFAVQWDYKGEKGYGHVIEGVDDAPDRDADGEEQRGELGEQGGGKFPRWFATEIIGSMLELEPRQWRKPRRIDYRQNHARVADFRKGYDKYDWTKQLRGESVDGSVQANEQPVDLLARAVDLASLARPPTSSEQRLDPRATPDHGQRDGRASFAHVESSGHAGLACTQRRPKSILFPTSPAFVPASLPALGTIPTPAKPESYPERYGPLSPNDLDFLQEISQTMSAAPKPALDGLWEAASSSTVKVILKRPDGGPARAIPSSSSSSAPAPSAAPTPSSPPASQPPGFKIIAPTPSKIPLPISPVLVRVKRTFVGEDDSDEEASTVPSNWSSRSVADEQGSESDMDTAGSDTGTTPTAHSPTLSQKPLPTLAAELKGSRADLAALEASAEKPRSASPSLSRRSSVQFAVPPIPPFRAMPAPFVFGSTGAAAPETFKRKPESPSRQKAPVMSKEPPTVTVYDRPPKVPSRSHTASVPPPSHRPSVPAGASVYAPHTPAWTPTVSHNTFPTGPAQPAEWSPAIADAFLQSLYSQQQFAAGGAPSGPAPYFPRPGSMSGPPPSGPFPSPGSNSFYHSPPPFQPYPSSPFAPPSLFGQPFTPQPSGHHPSNHFPPLPSANNAQQPTRSPVQQHSPSQATSATASNLHPSPVIRSKEAETLAADNARLKKQTSELSAENAQLRKQTSELSEVVTALEKGNDRLKLKAEKTRGLEEDVERLQNQMLEERDKMRNLEKSKQATKEGAMAARAASQVQAARSKEEIDRLKAEAATSKATLDAATSGTAKVVAELVGAEEKMRAYEDKLRVYEDKLRAEEASRSEGIVAIRRLGLQVADLELQVANAKASAASASVGDTLSRAAAFRMASKNLISDEDFKALQAQVTVLREKLAKAENANSDLQRQMKESSNKGSQELETARALATQLTRKVEELRGESERKKDEHDSQIAKLTTSLETAEGLLEDLVSSCENVEVKNASLQADLSAALNQLAEGRGAHG